MVKKLVYDLEIAGELFIADTFIKRFIVFLSKRAPKYDMVMLKGCNSIHTYFMKFEIDVIFINSDMKVIKKVEALQPGKSISPVKEAVAVIKAKSGTFKKIKEGKRIGLIHS